MEKHKEKRMDMVGAPGVAWEGMDFVEHRRGFGFGLALDITDSRFICLTGHINGER